MVGRLFGYRKLFIAVPSVFVALVVAVAAGVFNGGVGDDTVAADRAVLEVFENLAEAANELKGAEVEMDVVFHGATLEDAETLTYTYTVGGVANRPFDARMVGMATDRLNRESCADRIVRTAIDDGGVIRYVYRSPGGTRLLAVDVDRQSCLTSQ